MTEIKKISKKNLMVAIFIDFKSAYNTILRKKLYEILEGKLILEREEVKFLEILHGKLTFKKNFYRFYADDAVFVLNYSQVDEFVLKF